MASNKKQILVPDISRREPAKNRKDYVVHKKKKPIANVHKKKKPIAKYAALSDTLYGLVLWCTITIFLLHISPDIDTRFSVLFLPTIALPWYFRKNN